MARIKRATAPRKTVEERLRIAEVLIVEGWQIALAAQKSLDGAPVDLPQKRFADADALFHRQHQRLLRELQGIEK